ncbi:hypothetical protein Tco_0921102 [Tanacetum coccineum]
MWTPKLPNTILQLKRFPKAKILELKVDSEENNLQNTYLSPPLRHPNPNLAIQRRKLCPVRPWTQAKAILHLPHHWLMKCIKRHSKQLVAQYLYEPLVKKEPTLSSVVGMDEGTKNYSFAHILIVYNPTVLVDKTKSTGDGLKTAHTTSGANEVSRADDISQKLKLEDLSNILKDTRSAFFTSESLIDEPIIVSDESEKEENTGKDKDTEDTSKEELEKAKLKVKAEVVLMKTKPSYPDINQLTELLVTSLKPKLSKLLASHDFASYLPSELKEIPSKITGLSREIKELKQHIKDMEIELLRDLIEIPTKLESFTSTISSLSSQVAELKNNQWKPPAEFLNFLSQVSSVQKNLKTLDSLPRYATALPAEGEKNTKDAGINLKDELIDLLGKDVMTHDLHLTECREVLEACPNKSEKGWKTIYDLVKTRVDQLTQTEQELKIDLNQPLKEQDPLSELIDLANKKRKRTSDLRDHSSLSASVAEVPSSSTLQVLRRLGSIFTLVYAVVQKLKKDSWLEL